MKKKHHHLIPGRRAKTKYKKITSSRVAMIHVSKNGKAKKRRGRTRTTTPSAFGSIRNVATRALFNFSSWVNIVIEVHPQPVPNPREERRNLAHTQSLSSVVVPCPHPSLIMANQLWCHANGLSPQLGHRLDMLTRQSPT